MGDESSHHEAPTRREYVKYGGTVVGGTLLAGCSGQSESEATPESTGAGTTTATGTETSTDDGPYTVEMFPVGEVEFKEVPETWFASTFRAWADMAVAVGQADGNRTTELSRSMMFYEQIDVDPDTDFPSVVNSGEHDAEVYYELDADVHFIDPNQITQFGLDEETIDGLEENVGPFFGSYIRRHEEWMTNHGYRQQAPTMLEAFEKVGQVFKEQERVDAMLDLHEEVQAEVNSRLSGVESAEIAFLFPAFESGKVYPVDPTGWGYGTKHFRDLNVTDVFEGEYDNGYSFTADMETLLEADPEHIVDLYGIHVFDTDGWYWNPDEFRESRIEPFENDPVGQELTAVQEGNIHPGTHWEQGPIINLFYLELTAQQLYPEQFGEFPFEQYPEVPVENQLFDRQRVADIIDGNV